MLTRNWIVLLLGLLAVRCMPEKLMGSSPMSSIPVLDVFCHCLPAAFCRAVERLSERPLAMYRRACAIRVMVDLDARRRLMDQFPGYQQILSLVSPTVEAHAGPDQAWELARVGNDAMAEMVTCEPERFPAFIASLWCPCNSHRSSTVASVSQRTDAIRPWMM